MLPLLPSCHAPQRLVRLLRTVVVSVLAAALLTTCVSRSRGDVGSTALECRDRSSRRSIRSGRRAVVPPLHVVVVAIDGVRWQDVFLGADPGLANPSERSRVRAGSTVVPELHRIAQTDGVLLGGDDSRVFVSSPSTVSLPGYSELFAGRTPTCSNNACPPTREPTLLDAWQRRDTAATLAVVSSWPRIPDVAAADRSKLLISAGRHSTRNLDGLRRDADLGRALERGKSANPFPGDEEYRPDRFTAEVALRLLELTEPSFLFLGLGDTDEYAHQRSYASYLDALGSADRVIRRIHNWLAAQQRLGRRTLLMVTTDHGRAASFQDHGNSKEAARIWMLWAGSALRATGYPSTPDIRLADVAPTLSGLLGLDPGRGSQTGRDLTETITFGWSGGGLAQLESSSEIACVTALR